MCLSKITKSLHSAPRAQNFIIGHSVISSNDADPDPDMMLQRRLILLHILSDDCTRPAEGCLAFCNTPISSFILAPDYASPLVSVRLPLYKASAALCGN